MAHHPHHQTSRGALVVGVIVLTVLAALPQRLVTWVNHIGGAASMVVAPVASPIYRIARMVSPAPSAPSEEVAVLRNEIERWKALYLKSIVEKEEAERKFEALSKGAYYTEPPQAQLLRPVIGADHEGLMVRAGSRDNVDTNCVATTVGVQIVGRVSRAQPRLCWVRLITEHGAGQIGGLIMTSEAVRGPSCLLSPVAGGKLQGVVSTGAGIAPPAKGQVVRLADEKWPRSSQMLVVGVVDVVQTDSTGRSIVTVKPTLDLDRLGEVVIRVSPREADTDKPAPSTDGGKP